MTDNALVEVAVECRCPDQPHDGDTVSLSPTLGLRGGVLAQNIITSGAEASEIAADLTVAYVREGVKAWTFTDEKGKAVPVTPQTIEQRILTDFTYATPIANRADELYTAAVLDPLRAAASRSSRPSRTGATTSARTGRSSARPKRPKRSSTSTTPTAATAVTSG